MSVERHTSRRRRARGLPPVADLAPRSPRALSVTLALLCLATALYAHAQANDAELLRRANELGLRGDFSAADATAAQVGEGPATVDALLVQAAADVAQGNYARASERYLAAARRDPSNWIIRRDWALTLVRLGAPKRARRQFARARRLNPRLALALPTGGAA